MVNNKERYKFELGVKELNVESMEIWKDTVLLIAEPACCGDFP